MSVTVQIMNRECFFNYISRHAGIRDDWSPTSLGRWFSKFAMSRAIVLLLAISAGRLPLFVLIHSLITFVCLSLFSFDTSLNIFPQTLRTCNIFFQLSPLAEISEFTRETTYIFSMRVYIYIYIYIYIYTLLIFVMKTFLRASIMQTRAFSR